MKIKEIIKNVAVVLGLGDVVELINDGGNTKELLGNINYSILVRCASFVVTNIATNYIPLIDKQSFDVVDGKIRLSAFSQPFISARSVKRNGRVVEYKLYTGHLKVPNGRHEVEYSYLPCIKTGEEQNPFEVAPVALEYGILAEYSFISGMFNEANVWSEKFTELLFHARRGKTVIMPSAYEVR